MSEHAERVIRIANEECERYPTREWMAEYDCPKQLPALQNTWAGVKHLCFTAGLFVGLNPYGYEWRYCYPNMMDAVNALEAWDGSGDPPGPWIKIKGHPDGERLGPGATK